MKRFFAWLFGLPHKARLWIGKVLYWLGAGQFLIVMGFASWYKTGIRWGESETFYGLPSWTSFMFVGASSILAIVLGVLAFFLIQSSKAGQDE
jgi:hypothetical protein